MKRFSLAVSALSSVLLAAPVPGVAVTSHAGPVLRAADEPWELVPEEQLRDLRGGFDLGALVADFSIQRIVTVDGLVVARMEIVISNLNRLGNGEMPTISISGPLAQLVQVMSATGAPGVALAAASLPAPGSAPSPASSASAAATTAATAAPVAPNNGGVGTAINTQLGSPQQSAGPVATAIAAANGASSQPGPSTQPAPVAAGTPTVAQNSASAAAPAAGGADAAKSVANASSSSSAAASAPSADSNTRTIALGNTGQVIVLSNLPNATAITTAVQNSVRAATIQTQTTISATMNSLTFLNAYSLANGIRQQVASGP